VNKLHILTETNSDLARKGIYREKCSTEKLRKQDSSSILRGESYRRYGRGRNCGRKREREGVDQPHPSSVQPVAGGSCGPLEDNTPHLPPKFGGITRGKQKSVVSEQV